MADMVCPNCGKPAQFFERRCTSTEPHGETHEDVWLECSECGAPTDELELSTANRETETAAIDRAVA